MRRLLFILVLVALLVALLPALVYASPLVQNGDGQEDTDISLVIGTLGLYSAMMAMLAVGTEVMVEVVRPIFGLKRKRTVAEALNKLKSWMPATTSNAGLAAQSQERLNDRIDRLDEVTAHFEGQREQVRAIVHAQLPAILKDLAVHSVDQVFEEHWPDLERPLRQLENQVDATQSVDRVMEVLEVHWPILARRLRQLEGQVDTEAVHAWLLGTLNQLKGTTVAETESRLRALNNLFGAVARHRYETQSPARKAWRWLRDSPWSRWWLGWMMLLLQYISAWFQGKSPRGNFAQQLELLQQPRRVPPVRTMEEAAQRILELDVEQQNEEHNRIRWLRLLSGLVGIALANLLHVDSFGLLSPLLANSSDQLQLTQTLGATFAFTTPTLLAGITPGIILSGLGAAAGSGFWHDQLDKLRGAKRTVTQVQAIAEQFKKMGSGDAASG